jgi:hypothetical protein
MPLSYNLYTATSGQTSFAFTFPYLAVDHVKVSVNGTDLASNAYTVQTSPSTAVVLTTGATAGQIVRVYRKTPGRSDAPNNVPLVDFVNGSILSESDLDTNSKQLLYLVQESDDTGTGALNLNVDNTHWDAESLKIQNVQTPTANNDAANKTYVDTKVDTDAMTLSGGHWNGESRRINSVSDPVAAQDATTKNYVDSKFASDALVLNAGNWDAENLKITNIASPVDAKDAASKAYVDGVTFYTGGGLATPQSWVFSGAAGVTSFTLANPAPTSTDVQMFLVEVGGVIQRPTTNYTISGTTLTFSAAPPVGTNNIVVRNFGAVRNVAAFADDVTFPRQIIGGVGAMATSGVQDWNDVSNARGGGGHTLLQSQSANGPVSFGASVDYFHPFSFEYAAPKNGTSNLSQLAIPYLSPTHGTHIRCRYQGNWTDWHSLVTQPNAATPAIFVNSSSNVGINTKTPSEKLTVNNGAIGVVNTINGDAATVLRLRNASDTAGAEVVLQMPVHNNTSGLQIRQSSSDKTPRPAWDTGFYDAFIRTGQNGSKLHLAGGQNSSTPHLTIAGNGNVGINVTSPNSLLQAGGAPATNTRNVATFGSLTGNSLSVGYSGGDYSGIGYNLAFTDTNNTWNYRGTDRASLLRFHNGGFQFFGTATTGTANTSASLAHLATITSGGNLGIGVTPTEKLEVSGNVVASGNMAVNGGEVTTTSTGTAAVFNTTATALNMGGAAATVSIGAPAGTVSVPNLSMNAGYGSIAPVFGCRAWVKFSPGTAGTVPGGSYTATRTLGSTTCTITTTTAHGLIVGHYVRTTSNVIDTAAAAYRVQSVPSATTFTVTTSATGALSNSSVPVATLQINGSGNIHSVVRSTENGLGDYRINFATAMPDANYCCQVAAADSSPTNADGVNSQISEGSNGITAQQVRVGQWSWAGNRIDVNSIHLTVFR